MFDIKNSFFNVAHTMSEQINGHHRDATARQMIVLQHVIRVGILCAQVLTEAERFGFEPRFLQFNQYQVGVTIFLAHFGCKIDAKHGYFVAIHISIFVFTHFHFHHRFFEQGRKQDFHYTFVFKPIFENGVINGICKIQHDCLLSLRLYR